MFDLYPPGCITTSVLYSLAQALKRLRAWHTDMGGNCKDEPCLRSLQLVGNKIIACITFADQSWDLVYQDESWGFFGGDALK